MWLYVIYCSISEGLGRLDNPALMQQWFQLVQQKNSLVRYESELMILWVSDLWPHVNTRAKSKVEITRVHADSVLCSSAQELELEDRQSRLQQELREKMAVDGRTQHSSTTSCLPHTDVEQLLRMWDVCVFDADHLKEDWQLVEERLILEEMLEVVEQRDCLVSLLEEQRLQGRHEDQDLEKVMMTWGLGHRWTWTIEYTRTHTTEIQPNRSTTGLSYACFTVLICTGYRLLCQLPNLLIICMP